ncbi:hypothetical protein CPB84DRAFT_1507947 [Gymnopilus junonius]|uniref:SAM domain-containing protein n=1 Tax=Gymnopilus junonius TaxID=109634 RepID=A0A9P5NYR1_GYMJU|nr:hypothetical protein CPB84DRAFT_1507947 [Gymnopilus junonius]
MGSRGLEDKHVLDWDEDDVHHWFSELGYSQYGREIKVHNIQGDTLCMLDTDALVSLGVKTVGQRLSILKSIYHLKVAHAIPLNRDDYIPPSLASDEQVSIEDIHRNSCSDEITKLRSAIGLSGETLKATQKRIPFLQNESHPVERSTRSTEEDELTGDNQTSSEHAATLQMLPMPFTVDGITYPKLSLDDPTWKVLPAALRKHSVPRGLWQNYAMFISYGPPSELTVL